MTANFEDVRLPQRFWTKATPEPMSGCWLWMGSCNEKGYGLIGWNGKTAKAHILAYRALVGEVDSGLELDHRCRQRCCVNPAHLAPVTHRENVRRGRAGASLRERDACRHGHPYTQSNTRIASDGSRVCRECERLRMAAVRRTT